MADRHFPDTLVVGASASAYQIEGATRSDGRGESIWDAFSQIRTSIADGSNGTQAADHYRQYPRDIAIMRELGLQSYRFSLSWSRVLPTGWGKVNKAGIAFYDRLIDGLLAADIEPRLCLFHFDMPARLNALGGFLSRDIPKAMAEYAEIVSRHFGDRIRQWVTLDDPWTVTACGYGDGTHAPGRQHWSSAPLVMHHLLLSHAWAMEAIRANARNTNIAIGLGLAPILPASDRDRDLEAAWRLDGLVNRIWLDPLADRDYPDDIVALFGENWPEIDPADMKAAASPIDALDVLYSGPLFAADDSKRPYTRFRICPPGDVPVTATGAVIQPRALTELLIRLHTDARFTPPIIVQCGAAFEDPPIDRGRIRDTHRIRYLHDHLEAAFEAIDNGVNLHGVFVRSLLNGFEWDLGHLPRYGLVSVDFTTQQRTIKESGRWMARAIDGRALVDPD